MNFHTTQTVSLNTAIGTTDEIPYGEFADGMIHVPTGSSVTTLTWWSCQELGGTYVPAMKVLDDALTPATYIATVQTVAQTLSYPIPASLKGSAAIKAVTNAAGTVYLSLKSS